MMRTSSALFALLLALGVMVGCKEAPTPTSTARPTTVGAEVGSKAPNFSLPAPDGELNTLTDYRGKVVLIDFWASWCGPCLEQLPNLKALWNNYRAADFVILGVSHDYTMNDWRAFLAKEQMDWEHVFDNGTAAYAYQVNAIPQTFLIDREGVVIGINLHGAQLENAIQEALE